MTTPKVLYADFNEQQAWATIQTALIAWETKGGLFAVAAYLSDGFEDGRIKDAMLRSTTAPYYEGMTTSGDGRAQIIALMLADRAEILGRVDEIGLYRRIHDAIQSARHSRIATELEADADGWSEFIKPQVGIELHS
jgi:hypothetical protein